MDLNRLRRGDQIAGAGGIVLLLAMVLFDWYGAGGETEVFGQRFDVSVGVSAFQAYGFLDILLFLIAIVAIGHAVLTATQRSPSVPVATSVITTVAGALGALLVLYRIVNQPGPNEIVDTRLGVFIGLLACAAIAYGGFLAMREEESPGIAHPEPEVRPAPAAGTGAAAEADAHPENRPPAPVQAPEAAPAAATAAAGAEAAAAPASPPPEAGNPAPPGEGTTEPPAAEEASGTGPGEEPRQDT